MRLVNLLEALNTPYEYEDEFTYTKGVKKFIFQAAHGDYYHVILQSSMNLSHKTTALRVDFYNESERARQEAKGGDVDTAGATLGTGDAFRVFSTVIEIVREYVERAAPGLIVFKGRTDASRLRLYQRFAQSIGNVLPGYQFLKAVNDTEAGYPVITFMCKKVRRDTP